MENDRILKMMIKASSVADAEKVKKLNRTKQPILLRHLAEIVQALTTDELQDQIALTIALVAFWGMARLGEMMQKRRKRATCNGCTCKS